MKFKKFSVNKPSVLGLVLIISPAENEENLPVVSGSVTLDERVQRLSIEPLEVCPDVQHVNLCSRNHHSDEGAVISA